MADTANGMETPPPGNRGFGRFFVELRQRNVFRVGLAYAVFGWLAMQAIAVVLPTFGAPPWLPRVLMFLVFLGLPVALVLAWLFELTPEGIRLTQNSEPVPLVPSPANSKLNLLLTTGLCLLVVVLVLERVLAPEPASATATAAVQVTPTAVPADTEATQAPQAKTLAILPFANLSSDPEQAYFADGLTDELINTMSRIPGMAVTGRSSAFHFQDSTLPLTEIAGMLGVRYILQGSVRKAGNDLRITTQLTDIGTGFTVWSDTFDRQLENVFAIQEEIAREVADALSITLGAGVFDRPGMTRNVEAWEAYIKGLGLLRNRSTASVQSSISELERAVSLDPDFALAWYALGIESDSGEGGAYIVALRFLPEEETVGYAENAEAARARARSLAPALLRFYDAEAAGDWFRQEQLLQEELRQHPQDLDWRRRQVGFLMNTGQVGQAKAQVEQMRRLDPYYIDLYRLTAQVALYERDFDRARSEVAAGIALNPDWTWFYYFQTVIAFDMRDWQLAREAFQQMFTTREWGLRMLDQYLIPGDFAGAGLELEIMTTQDMPAAIRRNHLPILAGAVGRPELALQVMMEEGVGGSVGFLKSSFMDEVRQLPEFKQFLEQQGLVTYWRTTGKWPDFCRPVQDDFECF